MATTPKKHSKKSKVTRIPSSMESLSQLKKTIVTQEKTIATQARELHQAAEQQTATSEILRVIASSPTELQPVLDTVIANAVTLADADHGHIRQLDGDVFRLAAHYNENPAQIAVFQATPVRVSQSLAGRALLEGRPIQSLDAREDPDFGPRWSAVGARSLLAVPLLRKGTPIGNILIWRDFVEPFTEQQVDLVKTFADQAVIAIENVRLFQELENRTRELVQSVDELRALGEVGQAVSSTLDLETVLTRIASHAVQLTGAAGGAIYEYDEGSEEFHLRGSHQIETEFIEALRASPIHLGGGALGQAAFSRAPVEVPDILDEREFSATRMRPVLRQLGYRSLLAVPLLREEQI